MNTNQTTNQLDDAIQTAPDTMADYTATLTTATLTPMPKLVAQWTRENGQLVCRWINPAAAKTYQFPQQKQSLPTAC